MASTESSPGGESLTEVLRRKAEDLFQQGRADEARTTLHEALATRDSAAGTSRALLLEHLGRYLDAGSCSWQHDHFEESLAELRLDEPLDARVRVLCSAGFAFVRQGRSDEGMRLVHEALALTREADDTTLLAVVRTAAAEALLALGQLEASIEQSRRARSLGIESRHHHLVMRSYFNEARATYLSTGSVIDALRIRKVGLRYASDLGQLTTEEGSTLRIAVVEDMIEAGQWPEALDMLGPETTADHESLNEVEETLVRSWLLTWRGERPTRVPPFALLVDSSSPLHRAYLLSLALAAAGRLKDYATVEELTGRALIHAEGYLTPPSSGLYVIDALACAIEAQRSRAHTLLHPDSAPERLLDSIERIYPEARRHVAAKFELTDGVVCQARAQLAEPREAADHWDQAILIFRRTHARARLVPALLERAALCAPDDPHARILLDEAEHIARHMRATPYLDRIGRLRRIEAAKPEPASPPQESPLTARQLEVVAMLAGGSTDREIAGTLDLSVRTVNAHVAQILTRLDVRNRAEAAAWYYRTGTAMKG